MSVERNEFTEKLNSLARDYYANAESDGSSDKLNRLKIFMDDLRPEYFGISTNSLEKLDFSDECDGILYRSIHDDELFTCGIFILRPDSAIPNHNHPKMTVLSKILYGDVICESYESTQFQECLFKIGQKIQVKKNPVRRFSSGMETCTLYPDKQNIHAIHSSGYSAFIDVIGPPYSEERPCTFFRADEYQQNNSKDDSATLVVESFCS